ncbi:hypothetical protein ANRL2_04147 [Anaerolineae bacterium]|nr:hypothetical protein ANRL2_04147 [Anaerolineae bacterium]
MSDANPPTLQDLIKVLKDKYEKPNKEFLALLKDLFSHGIESDHAFHFLMSRAGEFFDELVTIFEPITKELSERTPDSYTWYHHALVDCIACAPFAKAKTILWKELRHNNPQARLVVINALARIGKREREARKILWNARTYELDTPEATAEFVQAIMKALEHK